MNRASKSVLALVMCLVAFAIGRWSTPVSTKSSTGIGEDRRSEVRERLTLQESDSRMLPASPAKAVAPTVAADEVFSGSHSRESDEEGGRRDMDAALFQLSEKAVSGSKDEAIAALSQIGDVCARCLPDDVTVVDAPEDEAALAKEAKMTKAAVEAISSGLFCDDVDIRMAAYGAMRSAGGEVTGVLVSQVMRGRDAELKHMLLSDTAGKITDRDISVSMMALSDLDASVRDAAFANLEALLGRSFETEAQARDWWEKNHVSFLSGVDGASDGTAMSEVMGPANFESDDVAEQEQPSEDISEPENKETQTQNERIQQ